MTRAAILVFALGCSQAAKTGDMTFQSAPLETVTSTSGALTAALYAPASGSLRGAEQFKLHIDDASGAPKDELSLSVVPWMPSHAHGTSVVPVVVSSGHGDYVLSDMNLFMPGRWQLLVSVTGAMTDSFTLILDVP